MENREYWSVKSGMSFPDIYTRSIDLDKIADHLVTSPNMEQAFIPPGYNVKPGEKVLLAVNSFYDSKLVEAVQRAIVRAGAMVDVITLDMGEERELTQTDEFKGFIHDWKDITEDNEIRNWSSRRAWVEKVAAEEGYDLLIHGVGQPPTKNVYRSDTFPWTNAEVFPSAVFPREVWDLVERKGWDLVWKKGRGGKVRITDPEGTDISFTLKEEFYNMDRYKDSGFAPFFSPNPFFCHYWACPTPPYERDQWDATGVVSDTTNHFSCPYPNIKVYVENGKVTKVMGGGKYGDAWRELMEDTKDIQYPGYPDKGLFWFWEVGVGTNPKMVRPSNAFMLSGCGTTFERLRAGVVHCGFGTMPRSYAEDWAAKTKTPWGHLHVHMLNCNYEITTKEGEVIYLIKNGRLTSLDDPEVIACAAKYGDPKDILKEDWKAPIPGITVPGDYKKDYAPDPMVWLKAHPDVKVEI